MIEFKNVTKNYGNTKAIDDMSLSIPEAGIYCLLGRNGAGKTTFLKMLAGHIPVSEGEILVDGNQVSPGRMPESINFVENQAVQFNMKISDLIDTANELQEGFDREFAQEMVRRFDLNPNKKYKQLSFGMKTMLTTIITLANNSKAILLDEPTLGFDAIMRDQFNTILIESYQNYPRVIIVSTHLIDEIAKVVERLIIIDEGKVLLETSIDEVDEKAYTLTGTVAAVEPLLGGLNCIGKTVMGSVMAAYIYDDRIMPPDSVSIDRISLQDFFISIVGGKGNE